MAIDWTPLLRLYAGRRLNRLARLDPVAAQEAILLRLVQTAAGTRFGRDHGFSRLRSVAAFQDQVPLRRYEAFWDEYWGPAFPVLTDVTWPGTIRAFAASSGTSRGASKYIPLTPAINRANTRAGLDLLCHHLANRPDSRCLGGRSLLLGGSTALTQLAPGIVSGDLSGIAAKSLPPWARPFRFPPLEIALLADWEEKVRRIARAAAAADVRVVAGTPSWLLLLFAEQARQAGRPDAPARDLYPNLDLLIHGGVHFAPYRSRFEGFLAGTRAELREVYPASEGFIAVADRGPGEGLRLMCDNGLFYEFVPVEDLDAVRPIRHWAADVEPGVNYALVLSSCAGLFAYVIGDTVRLVERNPPRLLITGRTSTMLSAFGEHLIGEEIEQAVADAAAAIGADVTDFTVGARFPSAEGARGGHLFLVEFAAPVTDPDRLGRFAAILDHGLAARNDDYRAHRGAGFGLDPPVLAPVPPGSFAAWMKSRGRLGGQNKVPRVINDPEMLAGLRAFVAGRTAAESGPCEHPGFPC